MWGRSPPIWRRMLMNLMESVNKAHGLRSEAEAFICSLGIDRFVRL